MKGALSPTAGPTVAMREKRGCLQRGFGGVLLQYVVAATDSWAMRRRVTAHGLLQAYASILALCFGAGALLVGGPRASTWAILSLVMAAALLVSWLAPQGPSTGNVDGPLRDGPRPGNGSDLGRVASSLVDLLENSQTLPLVRQQVRVKKSEVYELVAAIRRGAADDAAMRSSSNAVLTAAEAVEDAVYHATPVPLTDDVRLRRERVTELLDGLRAAGA
jgi:hypothetical protein